jgi:hypothetical protein
MKSSMRSWRVVNFVLSPNMRTLSAENKARLINSQAYPPQYDATGRAAAEAFASDRDPIVLHKQIPGMGRAQRYIITIASDDRAPLDKLRQSLITAGAACDVLRNSFGQTNVRAARE